MSDSEFNEDGSLKIFDKWKKEEEHHRSARNVLLLSDKIIEVEREIVSEDTPQECNVIIKVPENFNMKLIERVLTNLRRYHESFSDMSYDIQSSKFILNIKSGSKRHSFCKYFLEKLDKMIPQETILVNDPCSEWYPVIKDKLEEDEYSKIIGDIVKRRLEYFATDTSKYREQVLARDKHKCLSCDTDGKKPYIRKNGKPMANPLQIHHLNYYKDSLDSLITLCNVCHFKLHLRLKKLTGSWSSKIEDMQLIK